MSITLSACAIDIERLRGAVGSRRTALLNKALTVHADRIHAYDRELGLTSAEPRVSLADGLRGLVEGRFELPRGSVFLYERALVLLAETMGEPLATDAFEECSPALWTRIQADLRACRDGVGASDQTLPTLADLLRRGPPVEMPMRPPTRRETAYLGADEVRLQWPLLLSCRPVAIARAGSVAAESTRALAAYAGLLQAARSRERGLFIWI